MTPNDNLYTALSGKPTYEPLERDAFYPNCIPAIKPDFLGEDSLE